MHNSKALFKDYHCWAWNLNFIKGTVRNVHKTVQRKLSWVMLLCFYHVKCAEKFVSTGNYFLLKASLRAITSR